MEAKSGSPASTRLVSCNHSLAELVVHLRLNTNCAVHSVVLCKHHMLSRNFSLLGKGSGFKSVASALIQSRADSAENDSKAAQSRLYGGTASSEAKRREMIARAQKETPTDDGMLRISPEDLANLQAELAKLRETVQKLQPLDPENAQLKRTVQSLQYVCQHQCSAYILASTCFLSLSLLAVASLVCRHGNVPCWFALS